MWLTLDAPLRREHRRNFTRRVKGEGALSVCLPKQ